MGIQRFQDLSARGGSQCTVVLDKVKRFYSKMKVDLGNKAAMVEKSMLPAVL